MATLRATTDHLPDCACVSASPQRGCSNMFQPLQYEKVTSPIASGNKLALLGSLSRGIAKKNTSETTNVVVVQPNQNIYYNKSYPVRIFATPYYEAANINSRGSVFLSISIFLLMSNTNLGSKAHFRPFEV